MRVKYQHCLLRILTVKLESYFSNSEYRGEGIKYLLICDVINYWNIWNSTVIA